MQIIYIMGGSGLIMDYRNNPPNDRKRLLVLIEKYIMEYLFKNEPHEETVEIIVPEIELSPDCLALYGNYKTFLSANRRKILADFSHIHLPFGMIVQLSIDYEARVHICYLKS